MLKKIEREVCLACYRCFPLSPYDPRTKEEVFFFPKVFSIRWFELYPKPIRGFSKRLASEFTRLIQECKIESLIFLGDKTSPWTTKLSAGRTNYPPLTKAMTYFKVNKLGRKFNGGVDVPLADLPEFLEHFYVVTRADASFHAFYFLDPSQGLLGFIHHSGEIQFCTLNKKMDDVFLKAVKKTSFKEHIRT